MRGGVARRGMTRGAVRGGGGMRGGLSARGRGRQIKPITPNTRQQIRRQVEQQNVVRTFQQSKWNEKKIPPVNPLNGYSFLPIWI